MASAQDPATRLVLALDQGGSGSRAIAYDRTGRATARAQVPVGERRAGDDRVEQDADELVGSLRRAAESCLGDLGARVRDVACAGLATQRSSVVAWERGSGAALSPVLSWQDRRASDAVEALAGKAELVRARTGLRLSPHYGASKLAWLLEHEPRVRAARERGSLALGPLASLLAARLLEGAPSLADPANASRTQLVDLRTGAWDEELCRLFGVPCELLPARGPTRGALGTLRLAGHAIPFRVLTGDQSAAVFAWGSPRPDTAYVNLGTGGFVQRPVEGVVDPGPRLLVGPVLVDGGRSVHVVEGTINGAGAALRWAGHELGIVEVEEGLEGWLRSVTEPPLFLNGVSGLAAPFWSSGFESRFVGEGDGPARIVAVAESVVFLVRAILEEMARALPPPTRVRLSGGLSRVDGLCARLASACGLPVDRAEDPEATSRGLAWLLAETRESWPEVAAPRRFEPVPDALLDVRYRRWREALERALPRQP